MESDFLRPLPLTVLTFLVAMLFFFPFLWKVIDCGGTLDLDEGYLLFVTLSVLLC